MVHGYFHIIETEESFLQCESEKSKSKIAMLNCLEILYSLSFSGTNFSRHCSVPLWAIFLLKVHILVNTVIISIFLNTKDTIHAASALVLGNAASKISSKSKKYYLNYGLAIENMMFVFFLFINI